MPVIAPFRLPPAEVRRAPPPVFFPADRAALVVLAGREGLFFSGVMRSNLIPGLPFPGLDSPLVRPWEYHKR